ncbi:MAG: class I SAM-dependent methyltransferase [Methyloceanibacter sp.]
MPDTHWFAGKCLAQLLPGGYLYRCRRCQLKFRHPVQEAAAYQRMYDNAATSTWPMETPRADWDLIIDHIHKYRPQGGRVLDFGCYSGGLLARLDSSYKRYGVEINRAAAVVAWERSRAQIWPSIGEIPKELQFDVIVAADVIEHMQNPEELIDRLAALLTEHGVLIITTGDADNYLWNRFGASWWYCFYPEHIAFISRTWLDYLSQTGGLSVMRCETFRYNRHSAPRRFVDTVFTYCYGLFPATYLQLGNFLKRMLDRQGLTSVPGNGVSADHLLIVLARKVES